MGHVAVTVNLEKMTKICNIFQALWFTDLSDRNTSPASEIRRNSFEVVAV